MHEEGRLNATYLIGTVLVHIGAGVQIAKILSSQQAEDIALLWVVAICLGHVLHMPRSLASNFWVWKLNCIVGLLMTGTIVTLVAIYG